MVKICFVCKGNTCRSIMAERLMKKMLKQQNIRDVNVTSKGIFANGENIAENAKVVLKRFKALASNRKSVKLGKIDENTLYIVMTENLKPLVKSAKLLSVKDLTGQDVADPYGADEKVYYQTAVQIIKAVEYLIEKIKRWREK